MEKQEVISLIVVAVLAIPSIIFLYLGLLKLVDFALVYAYTGAAAMVIILAWGFRHRIERTFAIKLKSEVISKPELTVEYDENNIKQYSPFVDGHGVLRIRVINNGDVKAKKCEARVEVFNYEDNRLTEEIYVIWTKNGKTKSDIPKHDSVFLNVVFSTKDSIDDHLAFVAHPKSSDFSIPPRLNEGLKVGDYKLKIRIKPPNSDEALYTNFNLHVNENWEKISMSKIDEHLSSE